jgi:hypothetical protein
MEDLEGLLLEVGHVESMFGQTLSAMDDRIIRMNGLTPL